LDFMGGVSEPEEVFKEQKLDLFRDYISSMTGRNKKSVWDVEQAANYSPYVVDMLLGRDISTILYANEMNRLPSLPKSAHYRWMLYSIPKGRKKMSGGKKDKGYEEKVKVVMEYYDYSNKKAREALFILTDADLETMRNFLDKGGR